MSPYRSDRNRVLAQVLGAAALLFTLPALAIAADIKLLAAGAVGQALKELVPQFELTTHHRVTTVSGSAGTLRALLERGDTADVIIFPAEGIAEAQTRGWLQAGTRVDLASVGIGVAVRKGAALPDIATPEALKRALLDAKSVAYSRGTSGQYFDTVVLPALGIASEVRAKAKLQTEGSAAELVRTGDADIAVQQVSELLPVEGVMVVGLLPPSLQKITTYSAAIPTRAAAQQPARQLIEFLVSPASKAVFKAKGMDAAIAP